MRADGSSRFGVGNKWGYFPSGAFAWRLIDEEFIKDLHAFSDLKLRIGYGVTGNQEIGDYQSIPQYITSTANSYTLDNVRVPASNLLLAMLDKLGVPQDKHGDSTGKLEI